MIAVLDRFREVLEQDWHPRNRRHLIADASYNRAWHAIALLISQQIDDAIEKRVAAGERERLKSEQAKNEALARAVALEAEVKELTAQLNRRELAVQESSIRDQINRAVLNEQAKLAEAQKQAARNLIIAEVRLKEAHESEIQLIRSEHEPALRLYAERTAELQRLHRLELVKQRDDIRDEFKVALGVAADKAGLRIAEAERLQTKAQTRAKELETKIASDEKEMIRLRTLLVALQASVANQAKIKAKLEAAKAEHEAERQATDARWLAELAMRDRDRLAAEKAAQALRDGAEAEVAKAREIMLRRTRLFRSSRGYVDQHGNRITPELAHEIKGLK